MSKSFAGMTQCIYCGEPKGEIILDRRLKNSLEMLQVYDNEPCDKCKEGMAKGFTVIEVIEADGTRHDNFKIPHAEGDLYITGRFMTLDPNQGIALAYPDNNKTFMFKPDFEKVFAHVLDKGDVQ